MAQCPFHPKPHTNKASLFTTFFLKRRSWLDGLFEKSYSMKMGRVKMPGLDLHVVNDPKEVRRMMVDEPREFPKSELLHQLLEPLLGNSIFTTNDKVWEKQKNLLKPSFEMTRISKVFGLMSEATNDLIEYLDKNFENGQVVEVDAQMTHVTADVIFRTILSQELDRKAGEQIIKAFITYQEETARAAMRKMFCFPQWLSYYLGENKRIKAGEEIREVLSKIIQPRYDAVTNNTVGKEEDILSTLLQVVDLDTNKRFSFKEILDQVAMLFLAGHETTASSLTWTLYLLSMFPEEQERAYQEVLEVAKDEKLTIQHIRKMKHLTNIFKETLRLYPPVGFFARESKNDTTMRGKDIKKGVGMVVAPWLIHRHKDFWDDPNGFNPSIHEDKSNIKKDTYFPFGMGERVCIGQGFAMQEAILILSSILRNYKLELEKDFVPDVVGRLTVRSANGMNIILTKREK